MEIGILGLPQSGKSTLFEIMTGIKSREIFNEPSVRGIAKVPDARFDELANIFKPKKVSPATIPFVDICAHNEEGLTSARQILKGADGILHVVDAFTAKDSNEVISRYKKLSDDMLLSDLMIIENRLERLGKLPKTALKPEEASHAALFPKLKDALEAGTPLRSINLNEQEIHILKSFSFWTIRPELVVLNCRDDNLILAEEIIKGGSISSPVIGIACLMEAEVAELEPSERKAFLEPMGIKEAAFERVIQKAFSILGRICYFTVGEDEVKAWVIPSNSTAPRAAAAIHKDFERGFIKAEVVSYKDFMSYGKTIEGAKSAGKLRLEGKEYLVQDGDIISFRFNV